MLETIKVLQLGTKDWHECYRIPEYVDLLYVEKFTEAPKFPYEMVFIDGKVSFEEIKLLHKATKPYSLYVTEDVNMEAHGMDTFFTCKKGKVLARHEIQDFLSNEVRNYYPKPYGEKFSPKNMAIAQGFSGSVRWDGYYAVYLDGDYGQDFSQIVYWRNNIPIFEGQAIDFWLEYEKDSSVEIQLVITQYVAGTLSRVQQKWVFSEQELDNIVTADNQLPNGPIFVSLLAKGKGKLKVVALHDRYSRRGHGHFLPGGKRYVTKKREEIFYYFDPADMKPPLNIYFSGYKTMQGFEGYNMMKKMGCPFLLIAEPRLEGGAFYMGDKEYEKALVEIIKKHMIELGFSREQVIMSGLSMGTYGTLFYGCDILPHALILGKPLASVGDIATNERLHRPGGFPTSLDVLGYQSGGLDEKAVEKLNERFWKKFNRSDWSKSKFVVSYMIEDDYDGRAYDMLISHLKDDGVQVYGKGIHGRHNDATGPIASWFKSQYESILKEDFGRRMGK